VRRWHHAGWLSPGQYFTNSWTHSSGWSASIDVSTERDAVVLTYQTRHRPATEWKPISQRVPIAWTDCHFGGRRPWFICSCGRRVAVLFGLRDYFACRHCCELAYESQQEPIRMRGSRSAILLLGVSGHCSLMSVSDPKWTFSPLRMGGFDPLRWLVLSLGRAMRNRNAILERPRS
jgi:hypothetical protein